MNLKELIQHPESMDRETLYDLRSLLALYPYYQTARLLMLQNLYLLHDLTFDGELRRAALYIADRKVIFRLVEVAHYRLKSKTHTSAKVPEEVDKAHRTVALIDNFLDAMPPETEEEKKEKRRPTPADAAVDYVSYLMESVDIPAGGKGDATPLMKGQQLIDNFISSETGRIELKETPEFVPQISDETTGNDDTQDEGFFTETLARIYVKQGRYDKALEIIKRLNLNYPKKNAYFADQIRYLEKLIINNKNINR